MENILITMAAVTVMNIICFITGAKSSRTSTKREVNIPNPIKFIANHKIEREEHEEQERIRIMAENIDRYDGTGLGQQDV